MYQKEKVLEYIIDETLITAIPISKSMLNNLIVLMNFIIKNPLQIIM